MPTATLTFQLPEEAADHRCAVCGTKYRAMLVEVAQAARSMVKYESSRTAEQLTASIWTIFNEYHFDPWDDEC